MPIYGVEVLALNLSSQFAEMSASFQYNFQKENSL